MAKMLANGLRIYPITQEAVLIAIVIPRLLPHPAPDIHLKNGHSAVIPKTIAHIANKPDSANKPGHIIFPKVGQRIMLFVLLNTDKICNRVNNDGIWNRNWDGITP